MSDLVVMCTVCGGKFPELRDPLSVSCCPACGIKTKGFCVWFSWVPPTYARQSVEDINEAHARAEAEQLRQERHHDIMARTAEVLAASALARGLLLSACGESHARIARLHADHFYPPPKVDE